MGTGTSDEGVAPGGGGGAAAGRVCPRCGKPVAAGGTRRKYHPECGKEAQKDQLRAWVRANRKPRGNDHIPCAVCGEPFVPRSKRTIYCKKPECKREGVRRAVARQGERRRAAPPSPDRTQDKDATG